MVVTHKINFGTGLAVVANPVNNKALELVLNWEKGSPNRELQSISLEWAGDTAKKINAYRNAGLFSGGLGIMQGLQHRIESQYGNLKIIDTCIDLANSSTEWECDLVKAPIRRAKSNDAFDELTNVLSFSFLAKLPANQVGKISQSDYTLTPFTVTRHRTSFEKLSLTISAFVIIDALQKMIRDVPRYISKLVTEIAAILTVTYTLAGLIKIISKVLGLLLYLVYIIFLFISLLKLVIDILFMIFPPPRFKKGMKVYDTMKKVCDYLGLGFQSSILTSVNWKDAIYLPQKITIPSATLPLINFDIGADESINANAHGYPEMTAQQYFEEMSTYFNAERKIINGTLYFERRDKFYGLSTYVLKNTDKAGYSFNYPDPHTTNASELPMDYFITYQIDNEELNTFQRYNGTCFRNITYPITVNNLVDDLSKTKVEVRFNIARALRKNYLNEIETFLNNDVINSLYLFMNTSVGMMFSVISQLQSGQFPPSVQPLSPIITRLGFLELSSEFIGTPKIFIGDKNGAYWHVHPQSENITAAKNIYLQFHEINTPLHGAQWIRYKNKIVSLCEKDFNSLSQNNYFNNYLGKKCELKNLKWNLDEETCLIDYRIQQNFTNNLQEKQIENERT